MTSFNLIKNASGATISDIWKNESCTLLSIEIADTFTGAEIIVEARINPASEWSELIAFDNSALEYERMPITKAGLYYISIEGVAEIRVRVASVDGGTVNIKAIFYDFADGKKIPSDAAFSVDGINPFSLNSNMFLKGIADVTYFDSEGDIVGYEKLGTGAEIQITSNLQAIDGGFGNKLMGVIPDSVRITGTYTEQAFSLEEKALGMSQSVAYGANSPYCERIEATSSTLTVSKTPVPHTGHKTPVCYIRKVGGAWSGIAYDIDPNTREIQDFTATINETYEVQYFVVFASSQYVGVPTVYSPKIYTVQIKMGAYALQKSSQERGNRIGWMYFIVPRAIFHTDEDISVNGTQIAESSHTWMAVSAENNSGLDVGCPKKRPPLGWYVFVPCDEHAAVVNLAVIGGGLIVKAKASVLPPVKYVMQDGSLVQPEFSSLTFVSKDSDIARVTPKGEIMGISEGTTKVEVYASGANGSPLKATFDVIVTSSVTKSFPKHFTVI